MGEYNLATPTTDDWWPSSFNMRSAGPFNAAPPMIGEMATTDDRLAARTGSTSASARIGPIDTIGLDGAITMHAADFRIPSTPGARVASDAPTKRTAVTGTA